MADDGSFNSMQAQLGLVGGSGGFNPLGIATPAPPPPPPVRHPGDISQDIVRQTQTAMATTLQTTSAMRLGGMGGVAFGGGGAAGGGIGAAGAFAQQYQQNMSGINAQHVPAFSAQAMGMMGGMGSGFAPGMLPHPAMMTAPGMGIYRPFAQGPSPTVSPFPQMPMFQHPLAAMPPPPQFQTPMELSSNMALQAGQRRTAAMFAMPGVAARAAADVGFGYMGAGVGAAMGARFGPMGAAIGGTLGMAAGAFGSEHFGLGATAQHIAERMNPFRTMAIRGQQMQSASQDWVTGGPDLNMMTGRGLSGRGATHLGRMLEDTAYSSRFRRETGGAFSAQDLTKITNVAGQQGLLNDAQSVDQIHERVKGVAKSLVSFMKIANEPNVVEALKSMGRARQMGLSVGETMDMAMEARMYSKMAGQSVSGIMGGAGMQGAMMYQQQGLSAGLGMRMGMGAMGSATAAVGAGAFSPQRLAMLGGTQGVAQREMEMNAAFLKQPMMAMALSTMGKGGEFRVDAKTTREMMSGKMDVSQMATRGVDNLLGAVRKQGVGAIAMQEMQSTELQDTIGRIMGPGGTQMARMNQIEAQRKFMNLEQNPGGYAMAGRTLGFSPDDMKQTMGMANSPGYFDTQRRHMRNRMMEARALESEDFERNRMTAGDKFANTGVGTSMRLAWKGARDTGEDIVNFFQEDEETKRAKSRGQIVLKTPKHLLMSDEEFQAADKEGMTGTAGEEIFARDRARLRGRGQLGSGISRGMKDTFLGGNDQDLFQRRQAQAGLAGAFGGGLLERGTRLAAGLSGLGAVTDFAFGSAKEIREANEDTNAATKIINKGMSMTAEEEGDAKRALKGVEGGASGAEIAIGLSGELGKASRAKEGTGTGLLVAGAVLGGPVGLAAAEIFGGKTDNAMGKKDIDRVTRAYLEKKGIKDPTQKQIDEYATVAMKGAALQGGERGFQGRETINTSMRDSSMAELEAMRSQRIGEMVGTTRGSGDDLKMGVGMALARATGGLSIAAAAASQGMGDTEKAEIEAVGSKLFATGVSADAGTLAALRLAGEAGDEEAQKKADALELKMTTEGRDKEVEQAGKKKTDLKKSGQGATAVRIGTQMAKGTKNVEELEALGAGWRKSTQASKSRVRKMMGSKAMSGRDDAEFANKSSIEKLRELSDGDISSLPEPTQKLVKEFQEAGDDEAMQKVIADKYSRLETKVGVVGEREVAGGRTGKADKMMTDAMVESAETQENVGKNFPNVDMFDSASRNLLTAAEYLMKTGGGGGGTDLPSGAVTVFESGGN